MTGVQTCALPIYATNIMARFTRTKLSPFAGFAWDSFVEGENIIGEKVFDPSEENAPLRVAKGLASQATHMMVPLTLKDIYHAMQEQGVAKGAALGILSIFGAGLSTYSKTDGRDVQSPNR